jgi:hypothetical protein
MELDPPQESIHNQTGRFPRLRLQFGLYLLGSSCQAIINKQQSEIKAGTYNAKPVISKKRDMRGNVTSRRFLRPNVSMVYTAGSAMTKFRAPKPHDARRAWISEKLACLNIVEE